MISKTVSALLSMTPTAFTRAPLSFYKEYKFMRVGSEALHGMYTSSDFSSIENNKIQASQTIMDRNKSIHKHITYICRHIKLHAKTISS